jgi:hypothetical protein
VLLTLLRDAVPGARSFRAPNGSAHGLAGTQYEEARMHAVLNAAHLVPVARSLAAADRAAGGRSAVLLQVAEGNPVAAKHSRKPRTSAGQGRER